MLCSEAPHQQKRQRLICASTCVCLSAATRSDSSSDESEVLGAPHIVDSGPAPVVPDFLEGGKLETEDGRIKHGYFRYTLKCTSHARCQKRRNAGPKQCAHFGVYEPLAYLAVWQLMGSEVPEDEHRSRAFDVPLEPQRQWLLDNGYI